LRGGDLRFPAFLAAFPAAFFLLPSARFFAGVALPPNFFAVPFLFAAIIYLRSAKAPWCRMASSPPRVQRYRTILAKGGGAENLTRW